MTCKFACIKFTISKFVLTCKYNRYYKKEPPNQLLHLSWYPNPIFYYELKNPKPLWTFQWTFREQIIQNTTKFIRLKTIYFTFALINTNLFIPVFWELGAFGVSRPTENATSNPKVYSAWVRTLGSQYSSCFLKKKQMLLLIRCTFYFACNFRGMP